MARKPNTNADGKVFTEETKLAVWNKARTIRGFDESKIKKDLCGAWIAWDYFGETKEKGLGWEIDHIIPIAKGGGDELANLQPLQWQNNRKKGDDYPARNYCVMPIKQNPIIYSPN